MSSRIRCHQRERGPLARAETAGSTIVGYDGHAVGLLFAGSPFFTIANKVRNVEKPSTSKWLRRLDRRPLANVACGAAVLLQIRESYADEPDLAARAKIF